MITTHTIHSIALAIERKGIDFYEKLKDGQNDDIIDTIIADEKEHIRVFNQLYDYMTQRDDYETVPSFYMDEDMLIASYANTEIFARFDPETIDQKSLYEFAISIEKESILFYSQLDEMMNQIRSADKEREILKKLKQEEAKHLVHFIKLRDN